MDTCHALEIVARAVELCVSGEIGVVGGRVRVNTLGSNLRQSSIVAKRR